MGSQTHADSVHSEAGTVVIDSEKSHSNEMNSSSSAAIAKTSSTSLPQKTEYIEQVDSSNQKIEGDTINRSSVSIKSCKSSNHGNLDPGPPQLTDQGVVTLPFKQLIVVFIGLMLGVFLSSLDQTIINVCTNRIASEFNSLTEIPWVGTAYLLTSTCFQPLYGKFSDIFGRKPTFLFSITVFLVGSALCGAAQSMIMLIVARGIAGVGAGGIMSMVMIIITDIVSLRDRGKYQGMLGAVLASPLLLDPCWVIGAITLAVVIKLLHLPHAVGSLGEKIKRIDILGSITLIIGLVMILLPLNWGGSTYEWNSPIIIGLLVGGFAIIGIFLLIEWKQALEPIIPFYLFKTRTNNAVFLTSFFVGMGFFGIMFFMPLYFQIVRQESATASGLEMLPLIVGLLVTSIGSGIMVSKYGQFRPFIWIGLILSTTGTGLLVLLNEDSSRGEIIAYLFINGCGLGFSMQTLMIAIQSAVATKDIAMATANATFFRTVGSVFGVAISGTVFNNAVQKHLGPLILENPAIQIVITDSYKIPSFEAALEAQILHAYMLALRSAFTICTPFMGLAFICSLAIQHNKLRKSLGPTPME
ncbi:hypothetical protein BGZ74_000568 [Mortierella antarctica]|nr:hypothetical protein BGZ74_000568 [Mortierella antarctica]